MNPRHIDNITDPQRRAIAPYNFVELPEKVVEAELPLPEGDRYHLDRNTGRIECILTTESPLYTRCGWSREDFAKYGETAFKDLSDEIQKLRANFFINPATNQPVIPGSSIRGMLRTLVEIVSFSKLERVSDNKRLFFRAVASDPKKESWGKEYKQYVKPEIVKAGYLKKNGEKWYIQPAVKNQDVTFAWVEENDLTQITDFKNFNHKKYEPQYFQVIYGSLKQKEIRKNGRIIAKPWFASNITLSKNSSSSQLVTSGNMKQGDEPSPRSNHCIVFPENKSEQPLAIDDTAIEHYRNALTDFQKEAPFNKDWGVLEEARPVFYYHDGKSETVGFFGQSPNFRIPYSPEGNGHATTVLDFIPKDLRELASLDLADAIFGWIKQESQNEKLPDGFDKQRSGRIFVTDALCESNEDDIWYCEDPVTPQILSEPKSSYFPHYLVQSNADKLEVKHYASEPVVETIIRGHKLYWHKGSNPDFQLPPPKKIINSSKKVISSSEKKIDTQTTLIKLIKKGVTFKFDIYFENLSDVELGAILWVLALAQDEKYRLSLGMGKPLGMGAVKIVSSLYLSNRVERYSKLFEGEQWATEENPADHRNLIAAFENHILNHISLDDYPKDKNKGEIHNISELPRIQMLLAMLSWNAPSNIDRTTRYMEITRDVHEFRIGNPTKATDPTVNEYKDRPVLPTPLQVMGWDDKRRLNNLPPSPSTSGGSGGTSSGYGDASKPILKGQNKGKPIKKGQQSQQQPNGNSEGGNSAALARPQKPKS